MRKKVDVKQYYDLEANMEKKSTNFFLGFQPKMWKILENGTKIAYRNPDQTNYKPHKTFNIADIKTQEVDEENQFELITNDRVYELRAKTKEDSKLWQKAICQLKKDLKKQQRKNKSPPRLKERKTPKKEQNDSTLPSISPQRPSTFTPPPSKEGPSLKQEQILNRTAPFRSTNQHSISHTENSFSFFHGDQDELKKKFQEHFKHLTPEYLQYHVYVVKIKTKFKEFLTSKTGSNLYVIFSSKSLNPEEHISKENLSSAYLPHWADPDCFYRFGQPNTLPKLVFQIGSLHQIQEEENPKVLKVSTQKQFWEFEFSSAEEQSNFRLMLKMAFNNAIEVKDSVSRRNYDELVYLHGQDTDLSEFNLTVREMFEVLLPIDHQYQPWVIKKFTDSMNPLLNEILTTLQKKVNSETKQVRGTIVDLVNVVLDLFKRELKLVWDSSHLKCKGLDILNILKGISTYESLANKYLKMDKQLYEAQKQLSKIYVRTLYSNFQKIIINIVTKEKTDNYFQTEEDEKEEDCFVQTHSITDLFKFLYDFFNLAIPCWNNILHLNNIHKLTLKILGVFISELKSMIDEEEISLEQLIAISNNYVSFNEQVEEFYNQKFIELKEDTKAKYDKLQNDYRQISMVIIDRLVLPLKIQLKIFFDKQKFFEAHMERAYSLIFQSEICKSMGKVHFIFKKRYYERIFGTIRQQICKMLEKEVDLLKKKKDIGKVVDRINKYKVDCLEMAELLVKQKLKIDKELNEIVTLLTTQRRDEIAFIMTEASDLFKRIYKKITTLRQDYSSLNTIMKTNQIDSPLKGHGLKIPKDEDELQERTSFSKYYIQDFDRNSIEFSSSEKVEPPLSLEQPVKMISEGFVHRNKFNSGTFQKIFLRLKQGVLYIYQNDKIDRSQNMIQIEDIVEVRVALPDSPHFTIFHKGLQRVRQLQLRCDSLESRMSWVYSLQTEQRRLKNEMKMKVIKMKELTCTLIIDYYELENGKDYFSYSKD